MWTFFLRYKLGHGSQILKVSHQELHRVQCSKEKEQNFQFWKHFAAVLDTNIKCVYKVHKRNGSTLVMLPRINRHVMPSHEYGFQQSDHSEKVVQPCFLKLSVQMRSESSLYVKVYEGSQHAGFTPKKIYKN